jgi:hypothetical protein
MPLLTLKQGLVKIAKGVESAIRGDITSAVVVTGGHGYYREPASQGVVMIASTAVAGVAPGTALSTTPPMCLWNPPSSGRSLSVIKSSLGYVSGTLGAGTVVYAQYPQATVPTTGTELVPVNGLLSFPRGVGRAFQGSTLAGTPTIIGPAYELGAALATTATFQTNAFDLLDGVIEVPPGNALCLQGVAAAGSTPLVIFGLCWEEIDI